MDLLGFAQPVLTCNEPLHEFQVAQIEAQCAVDPDFDDVEQFAKLELVHTPARAGESHEAVLAALAFVDERRNPGFALSILDH